VDQFNPAAGRLLLTYSSVQKAFAEMPEPAYNFFNYGDSHWCYDFCQKLIDATNNEDTDDEDETDDSDDVEEYFDTYEEGGEGVDDDVDAEEEEVNHFFT
jgi:hypothetical protein